MKTGYKVTGTDRIGDSLIIICDTYAEAQAHQAAERKRGAKNVNIEKASAKEMQTPSQKIENELYVDFFGL